MTIRKPLDDMTSDDLDQLHDRLEKLAQTIAAFPDANDAANLAHARAQRDEFVTQAKRAEATLARLRDCAASLVDRGLDAMSAAFIIGFIDGVSEPERTTAKNPAGETATQATGATWQPDDNLDYDAPPPPNRHPDTPLHTGAALPAQEQP